MNIQKIYNAQINTVPIVLNSKNNRLNRIPAFAQPVSGDTVSFRARAEKALSKEAKAMLARKKARMARYAKLVDEAKTTPTKKELSGDERTWGVGYSTAQKIHEMVLKPQEKIHEFMHIVFDDLTANETSSKNLILKVSDRPKSVVSIMEKSATRKWNSIKEILANMTDLNGAKIVMNNKTGQKETETVLDRLIPLIRMKQVVIKEIELQRPEKIKTLSKKEQEEFDYASKDFIDKLEDIQEQVINGLEDNPEKIVLIDRPLPKYTKGNYCALHLLLQIDQCPRPFELQIMGAKMSKGKSFDDKRFKFFDGKQLDKKYDDLTALWEPLKADSNKAAKERFLTYCRDANFQLRLDEMHENRTQKIISRPTGFFKSVREYDLPPEYDLNEQYELMLACEKKKTKEEITEPEKHTLNISISAAKKPLKKLMAKLGYNRKNS